MPGADSPRVVYLGNLVPVAEALASLDVVRLAACVIEREDGEAAEFAALARSRGFDIFTVHGKDELSRALDRIAVVEFGVIANFGVILGPSHLAAARFGFVNAHLGLLPETPGRHPIRETLKRGEPVTGVTLHRVTADVDRGPVLDRRVVPVAAGAEGRDVFERLSRLASEMIAEHLRRETSTGPR